MLFCFLQEWEAFLGQIVSDVKSNDTIPNWIDQDRKQAVLQLKVTEIYIDTDDWNSIVAEKYLWFLLSRVL